MVVAVKHPEDPVPDGVAQRRPESRVPRTCFSGSWFDKGATTVGSAPFGIPNDFVESGHEEFGAPLGPMLVQSCAVSSQAR